MSWKKETTEIKKRRKLAKAQGGKEAIKLQHAKGRLTLRERIELLLDSNSFQEQGEIAGGSELNDEGKLESLTPANFILGFGKINNKQVVVGGEDFTVKGGSPNSAGLRKSVYIVCWECEIFHSIIKYNEVIFNIMDLHVNCCSSAVKRRSFV